jgi:hypothetical protein
MSGKNPLTTFSGMTTRRDNRASDPLSGLMPGGAATAASNRVPDIELASKAAILSIDGAKMSSALFGMTNLVMHDSVPTESCLVATMGQLRDRMEQHLRLKGVSPATIRNYLLSCCVIRRLLVPGPVHDLLRHRFAARRGLPTSRRGYRF